ncbi:hypothetical protein LU276_01000 [Moraxella haemolytica]|uniref:hypothetical protein n=1 Tax=Moraxella TaxID=475 RepID=UPI0025429FA3|nr:hypothetical protein [Moraxella sp. ZY171148]WII95461.1 hypothetical protein LU276_01000 [Moraxella sp. ZY171148]
MQKFVYAVLSLVVMVSACSKTEESPIEKAEMMEVVPMSAEPAEPTVRPATDDETVDIDTNNQALTMTDQDEMEQEIIESVDGEIPSELIR